MTPKRKTAEEYEKIISSLEEIAHSDLVDPRTRVSALEGLRKAVDGLARLERANMDNNDAPKGKVARAFAEGTFDGPEDADEWG